MPVSGLERLTAAERDVLRTFFATPEIKLVARALDRSPETIRAHLASARGKLGVARSSVAARLLAEAEGRVAPPHEANPPQVMAPAAFHDATGSAKGRAPDELAVAEERIVFRDDRLPTGRIVDRLLAYLGARHDLTPFGAVRDVILYAALLALATGVLLAGYATLSSLLVRLSH